MCRYKYIALILTCLALVTTPVFAVKKKSSSTPPKKQEAKAPEIKIPPEDILIEYQGGMVTKQDLENRISKLPPQVQSRYKTIEGQTTLLNGLAQEEVFYQKARDLNLPTDPGILEKTENLKKQFLVQEYYKRNITGKVELTETDKQAWFEQHKAEFYVQPYITILYIQPEDEAQAAKALKDLNRGKPFKQVSDTYSIHTYAKSLDGKIKNIRLNGNLPGIGNDPELEELIRNSPVDTLAFLGPQKTSTGWSIIQILEKIEGRQRSYLECEAEVDQRLRPQKENEFFNQRMEQLVRDYKVVIDSTLLTRINLREPEKNKDLEELFVATAPEQSLSLTVKQLLERLNKMSPQEQTMYTKSGGASEILRNELNRNLMTLDASRDKAYDEYLAQNDDYRQNQRVIVLQEAYRRLVVETVEVTPDDMRAYYDTHPELFTTPASRKITAVWCKDAKTARKAQKKYAAAARKNNLKAMEAVITKYSLKPDQKSLDNIYKNGIIPGIGPDQQLNDLVWNTPLGAVSPVTQSVKKDVLFFHVLEEKPATVKSYTEVEPRLQSQLKREKEKIRLEEVTEELYTQYSLKKYPEKLQLKLSPEELFNLADDSARQRKFRDAIVYYDQIIKFYPDGKNDSKALFMKAFLTSEEIGDKEAGLLLFKEFLKNFPDDELLDSAQYMVDELEGKNPLPEDLAPDSEQN